MSRFPQGQIRAKKARTKRSEGKGREKGPHWARAGISLARGRILHPSPCRQIAHKRRKGKNPDRGYARKNKLITSFCPWLRTGLLQGARGWWERSPKQLSLRKRMHILMGCRFADCRKKAFRVVFLSPVMYRMGPQARCRSLFFPGRGLFCLSSRTFPSLLESQWERCKRSGKGEKPCTNWPWPRACST